MCLHVPHKICSLIERTPAFITLVWSFVGVKSQVLLVSRLSIEALIARYASVTLHSIVYPRHVLLQVSPRLVTLSARLTDKLHAFAVRLDVSQVRRTEVEALLASRTDVGWRGVDVNQLVSFEVADGAEAAPARVAQVATGGDVDHLMATEHVHRGEAFSARRTGERHLAEVDTNVVLAQVVVCERGTTQLATELAARHFHHIRTDAFAHRNSSYLLSLS